jgi:hypothetical protein
MFLLTPEQAVLVKAALDANSEREHFREAYEGFNNCPAPTGDCDCGKYEADAAIATLSGMEW